MAFDFASSFLLECLWRPENEAYLRPILEYHVIPGTGWFSKDDDDNVTAAGMPVPTLVGNETTLWIQAGDDSQGAWTINQDTTLWKTNLEASDGVIHIVDTGT